MSVLIELAERRLLPDVLVRWGIRRLLRARLRQEQERAALIDRAAQMQEIFATGPIAVETDAANQQHYEVPAIFFQRMLGPRCKYSSCWWDDGCNTLGAAEEAMLRLTCERAQIEDGQQILDLGCGWGSLTLWLAEQYPQSQIVAVSNSRSQQSFIRERCQARKLANVEVRVCNVAKLELEQQFDRVLSIEMFEHVRNWKHLLTHLAASIHKEGKCFLHTFCHRDLFYRFTDEGEDDWMARHFFTGGVMPSFDLLEHLETPLVLEQQWKVGGTHYAKTCRAWLANLDAASRHLETLFLADSEKFGGKRQLARWRMFVMACEELFAFHGGNEWFVSHALLSRNGDLAA